MLVFDNFFGPFNWNTNSFPVLSLPSNELKRKKIKKTNPKKQQCGDGEVRLFFLKTIKRWYKYYTL